MKLILAMTAVVSIAFGSAGDTAPFLLDTREGTRIAREVEAIAYSTDWDDSERVCVAVDGVTLKEAVPSASGDVRWNTANVDFGYHTLTYTTYKNGVIDNVETVDFFVTAMCASAEPTVTDVVAKQRYPWNGLVDITCKVSGISGTASGLKFVVAAVMPNPNTVHSVSNLWVERNGTRSTDLAVHTNGSYRLVWDAQAELGQGSYHKVVMWVTLNALNVRGKVQLWEGGPYWAETNIGAEEPWEYGYYFWWGDTVGYKWENEKWVATDGSWQNYSFDQSNTPTYGKRIATLKSEGWITADGVLAPEHDAAHVQWGGSWRMPTDQELRDLNSKCDWTLMFMNGVLGYVIKGKGAYASASIFLPLAGTGLGIARPLWGYGGSYWSSVLCSNDSGPWTWSLDFGPSRNVRRAYPGGVVGYTYYRYLGQSIRPVQGFTE